jgi:hypothetical protein
MTTTQRKSRASTARAEVNGRVRTIKVRGVELELPKKVPFRVMQYLARGEAADAQDVVAVLETILGPQMEKVWDIDVDMSKGAGALGDLLNDVTTKLFDAYGLTVGE